MSSSSPVAGSSPQFADSYFFAGLLQANMDSAYKEKFKKIWEGFYEDAFNIRENSAGMTNSNSYYESNLKAFIQAYPMRLQLKNFLSLNGALRDFDVRFQDMKEWKEEENRFIAYLFRLLDDPAVEIKFQKGDEFKEFLTSKAALCSQTNFHKKGSLLDLDPHEEEHSNVNNDLKENQDDQPHFTPWASVVLEWGLETSKQNYERVRALFAALKLPEVPERFVSGQEIEISFHDFLIQKSLGHLLSTLEIKTFPACLEKLLKIYFREADYERRMVLLMFTKTFRKTPGWRKIVDSRLEIQHIDRFIRLYEALQKSLTLATSFYDHLLSEDELTTLLGALNESPITITATVNAVNQLVEVFKGVEIPFNDIFIAQVKKDYNLDIIEMTKQFFLKSSFHKTDLQPDAKNIASALVLLINGADKLLKESFSRRCTTLDLLFPSECRQEFDAPPLSFWMRLIIDTPDNQFEEAVERLVSSVKEKELMRRIRNLKSVYEIENLEKNYYCDLILDYIQGRLHLTQMRTLFFISTYKIRIDWSILTEVDSFRDLSQNISSHNTQNGIVKLDDDEKTNSAPNCSLALRQLDCVALLATTFEMQSYLELMRTIAEYYKLTPLQVASIFFRYLPIVPTDNLDERVLLDQLKAGYVLLKRVSDCLSPLLKSHEIINEEEPIISFQELMNHAVDPAAACGWLLLAPDVAQVQTILKGIQTDCLLLDRYYLGRGHETNLSLSPNVIRLRMEIRLSLLEDLKPSVMPSKIVLKDPNYFIPSLISEVLSSRASRQIQVLAECFNEKGSYKVINGSVNKTRDLVFFKKNNPFGFAFLSDWVIPAKRWEYPKLRFTMGNFTTEEAAVSEVVLPWTVARLSDYPERIRQVYEAMNNLGEEEEFHALTQLVEYTSIYEKDVQLQDQILKVSSERSEQRVQQKKVAPPSKKIAPFVETLKKQFHFTCTWLSRKEISKQEIIQKMEGLNNYHYLFFSSYENRVYTPPSIAYSHALPKSAKKIIQSIIYLVKGNRSAIRRSFPFGENEERKENELKRSTSSNVHDKLDFEYSPDNFNAITLTIGEGQQLIHYNDLIQNENIASLLRLHLLMTLSKMTTAKLVPIAHENFILFSAPR